MKICLIGNNNFGGPISDGQRIKVRTYLDVLNKEGFDIIFVELESWKKRFIKTITSMRKGIKTCDIVLIMAGPSGCRKIIPLVNYFNRKYKKRVVYSLIGTGPIFLKTCNMSEEKIRDLFLNEKYEFIQDKKFSKHLKKIDAILPETDLIKKMFENIYDVKNCFPLTNFRTQDFKIYDNKHKEKNGDKIKIVYLSRVMREKGIFDIINALNNSEYKNIELDIYGKLDLNPLDEKLFEKLTINNICYKGIANPSDVVKILSKYDFFVFPTRYAQEGVPGVIVESFLAGTPILSSNFGQAKSLLANGVDSLVYNMYDIKDLKKQLDIISSNAELRMELTMNAKKSGHKFTYEYVRKDFLKYITGEDVI